MYTYIYRKKKLEKLYEKGRPCCESTDNFILVEFPKFSAKKKKNRSLPTLKKSWGFF